MKAYDEFGEYATELMNRGFTDKECSGLVI